MAIAGACRVGAPVPVTPAPATTRTEPRLVPAEAPDSVPGELFADSNLVHETGLSDPFMRGIALVRFALGATQAERQAAVDSVHGSVVGGRRFDSPKGDGLYLICLPASATTADLHAAVDLLNHLPQIRWAMVNSVFVGYGTDSGQRAESRRPSVPPVPPDSEPGYLYADSSLTRDARWPGAPFMRDVVLMRFAQRASQQERQAAVEAVHGTVIGGYPFPLPPKEGMYLIRLPRDTTNDRLFAAITVLKALPQVDWAAPNQVFIGAAN
jgi:hypothetical protein